MYYGLQEIFLNEVLDNYFSGRSNYDVYIGLGLSNEGGSENLDDFIEPIEEGNGYTKQPFVCSIADAGITHNSNEIAFNTATKDWTYGSRVIDKVGLFNKTSIVNSDGTTTDRFTLWCVLPLVPKETVLTGDTVVINANAIRLQLTNR